ncbi:hypothetical protein LCGC14_1756200 [marine sediment metagenome]|uniref:Helix-turn-helix domain-containing protein n=1 Tax=marine sediment metagenome TaxID=412755 RepID=A0A0F9JHI2_9ZZZZ
MRRKEEQLGKREIEAALRGLPSPIVSPAQLAELVGISRSTLYEWIAKGRLDGAFRKRGKHVLVWLPRAIDVLFNGAEWKECE